MIARARPSTRRKVEVSPAAEMAGRQVALQLSIGGFDAARHAVDSYERASNYLKAEPTTLAEIPLDAMGLSQKLTSLLYDNRIRSADDLCCSTDDDLLSIPRLDKAHLKAIRVAVERQIDRLANAM